MRRCLKLQRRVGIYWALIRDDMMCATSRMVVKRKEGDKPTVMACTLLAYDQQFNMGQTLKEASEAVHLNHPHCSKFCVLGRRRM